MVAGLSRDLLSSVVGGLAAATRAFRLYLGHCLAAFLVFWRSGALLGTVSPMVARRIHKGVYIGSCESALDSGGLRAERCSTTVRLYSTNRGERGDVGVQISRTLCFFTLRRCSGVLGYRVACHGALEVHADFA